MSLCTSICGHLGNRLGIYFGGKLYKVNAGSLMVKDHFD